MTNKSLTYEQLYGEPENEGQGMSDDDIFFSSPEDDFMFMSDAEVDGLIEETLSPGDNNFDNAHVCPFCQQTYHLCLCDSIDIGEDY
jgi:hypothetical protein